MAVTAVKDKEQPERLNLRQKLVACMQEIERVEKRGENTAQRYKYVMAADIIDAARTVMAKHGIAFMANEERIESLPDYQTKSGATMSVVRVVMRFTFLDSDSDDRLEIISTGEGQDSGDKAVYKGKTGAIKYALQQMFLMSTGDDPEDDRGESERTAPAPARRDDLACPKCGNVGSWIMKRDGMWSCWGSKGGCEFKCSNEEYLKLTAPKPTPRGPQPINEPPAAEFEEFEEQPTRVDTNGGRMTERVVAPPDLIQQVKTLLAQSDDPRNREEALKKQCAVGDVSDLTPEQAQWAIDVMNRAPHGKPANGGKRQPRR